MLVIACVAIIVVGPKELPGMLRAFGKTIGKIKRMAGDFQRQVDDAIREADLDEVKDIASNKTFAPLDDAKKSMEEFARTMKDPLEAHKAVVNDEIEAVAEVEAPAIETATDKVAAKKPAPKKSAPKKAAPKKAVGRKASPAGTKTTTAKKTTVASKPAPKRTPANTKSAKKPEPVKSVS